jgi:hypothetical protein
LGIITTDVERLYRNPIRNTESDKEHVNLTEEQQHALARKYKNVILVSPAHSIRRPSILAELAWKRWMAGEVDDPATLAPTYLPFGEPIPG